MAKSSISKTIAASSNLRTEKVAFSLATLKLPRTSRLSEVLVPLYRAWNQSHFDCRQRCRSYPREVRYTILFTSAWLRSRWIRHDEVLPAEHKFHSRCSRNNQHHGPLPRRSVQICLPCARLLHQVQRIQLRWGLQFSENEKEHSTYRII